MTNLHHAAEWVNTSRYPIRDLQTAAGAAFAQQCRREYLATGLCILPDFIVPQALAQLAVEANRLCEQAYFCDGNHNAYLTEHATDGSADPVEQRQQRTFVGSVGYDLIDEQSALRQLYLWAPLKDFIGYTLDKQPLFHFADPLGACSINVFVDRGQHGWHFDESEFTVTLMLQPPESGGTFEYAPLIRGLDNEKALVNAILDGDRSRVVELPFTAGTLLIFGGQRTLHRVTQVHGARPRLVPVLCYSEQPGRQNSDAVRQLFWGRTGRADEVRL